VYYCISVFMVAYMIHLCYIIGYLCDISVHFFIISPLSFRAENPESCRSGPSGTRLLFEMQEILLGIQLILGGLNLILRSLLLHSLPLNRCHPWMFSWFSLQIHSPMARLLEIHFGNLPCRRSTTPSSRTRLWIWFPFL
jgi:hypothetical protein